MSLCEEIFEPQTIKTINLMRNIDNCWPRSNEQLNLWLNRIQKPLSIWSRKHNRVARFDGIDIETWQFRQFIQQVCDAGHFYIMAMPHIYDEGLSYSKYQPNHSLLRTALSDLGITSDRVFLERDQIVFQHYSDMLMFQLTMNPEDMRSWWAKRLDDQLGMMTRLHAQSRPLAIKYPITGPPSSDSDSE